MKKYMVVFVIVLLSAVAPAFVSAGDAEAFSIDRLVIAGSVEDREPVGVVDVFSGSTEKVYCFLDARDISSDTSVSFVWYFEDTEMARVELPLMEGSRWRTYSSKKLAGNVGSWKVELQDESGNVLETVEFTVE